MKLLLFIQYLIRNTGRTLETLLKISLFSRSRLNFGQRIRDETLILLANGPSLNESIKTQSDHLAGKNLMCVNLFAQSDYFTQLKPCHYVLISPDMWMDRGDERLLEKKKRLWGLLNKKVHWKMELYLPVEARRNHQWKQLISSNDHIQIRFFNRTPVEGFKSFMHFCFRNNLGMPRPHNVVIPALMIGINRGFNKIYLLGVDHSWLSNLRVDNQNRVLVNQKHFYDDNSSKYEPMLKQGGVRKLHEVLNKWVITFASYFTIDDYARSKGTKIMNATPDSYIDAFDRVDLNLLQ